MTLFFPEHAPLSLKAASISLLAALLVYPFTIAGSNFFFAILLFLIIFSQREVLFYGWSVCWQEYRSLTLGVLLIIAFNFVGSLWGPLDNLAFHKVGKQIHWLLIPVIIGLVHKNPKLKPYAFIALSIGMFLHLIVCTLQYQGILDISGQGSGQHDATGFVGHLNFGFIYGIWAGALLVVSQNLSKPWRYVCYALALYAVITVFMAQGRSGYITTFACLALVVFKAIYPKRWKLKLATLAAMLALLTTFALTHQPTQNKINRTIDGVSSFLQDDWRQVDMRIKIWAVSIEIWKDNPWFGVGTAGYPDAAREVLKKPEMRYLNISPAEKEIFYGHPHHEFLFALARWGPLGLLALLYLCFHWVRTGWNKDWQHDTINAYLVTASGISVILHGLTEPSLNTYIAGMFAIFTLGFGLSKQPCPPNSTAN